MVQDIALIQSFMHMITLHIPRSCQTSILCVNQFDEIHGEGLEVAVGLAMFLQSKARSNVLKRQHMDICSKDGSSGIFFSLPQESP